MAPPALPNTLGNHPDCCLRLSDGLFSTFTTLIPAETRGSILSIGSGSGLFEALLASRAPAWLVEGVEVNTAINKYLSGDSLHVVNGTWELCPRAEEALVWVFVYPRDPDLIKRYFDKYGKGAAQLVIYLGPKVDWPDFQNSFVASGFSPPEICEDCALAPYEMMAATRSY